MIKIIWRTMGDANDMDQDIKSRHDMKETNDGTVARSSAGTW
jgi:hypothetical protein